MKNASFLKLILNPLFWPTWLFLGLLRIIVLLPLTWIEKIGSAIGILFYYLRPDRVKVAHINLGIAFPEKTDNEIELFCRQNFKQLGIGTLEVGLAWWRQNKLIKDSRIIGLEHLQTALEKNNGVILLTSHFTCLEVGGHILSNSVPLEAVYKPARNKLFDYFMYKKRDAHLTKIISNDSPRRIISALKKNHVVWYAPDQNLRGKDMVFASFFNKQATAITAPSRLAKATNAALVPYWIKRDKDEQTGKLIYKIIIQPEIENFPSDDLQADAAKINAINEALVRENPSQYLWVHKRYKTRPDGEAPVY